jgi:hypothetical protein
MSSSTWHIVDALNIFGERVYRVACKAYNAGGFVQFYFSGLAELFYLGVKKY